MAGIHVLERAVYKGPHLFDRMPMVRFRLDLGPLEDGPTKQLPGFNEGLLERLPGLNRHGGSCEDAYNGMRK